MSLSTVSAPVHTTAINNWYVAISLDTWQMTYQKWQVTS